MPLLEGEQEPMIDVESRPYIIMQEQVALNFIFVRIEKTGPVKSARLSHFAKTFTYSAWSNL